MMICLAGMDQVEMATTNFKTLIIPTMANKNNSTGVPATVTSTDLNKTHFVINQLQTNTAEAFKNVLQNPIVSNGRTLKEITLYAGMPNVINHMLGQTLQGWTMSRAQGFTMLREDANQPNLASQIVLWTYIDTICDIVVW